MHVLKEAKYFTIYNIINSHSYSKKKKRIQLLKKKAVSCLDSNCLEVEKNLDCFRILVMFYFFVQSALKRDCFKLPKFIQMSKTLFQSFNL